MSSDERTEIQDDRQEDLELTDEAADNVRGGAANIKVANKTYNALDGYVEG